MCDVVADAVEAQRVTNYERAKSPNSTQTDAAHVVLLEPTLPSSTALVACTGPKKEDSGFMFIPIDSQFLFYASTLKPVPHSLSGWAMIPKNMEAVVYVPKFHDILFVRPCHDIVIFVEYSGMNSTTEVRKMKRIRIERPTNQCQIVLVTGDDIRHSVIDEAKEIVQQKHLRTFYPSLTSVYLNKVRPSSKRTTSICYDDTFNHYAIFCNDHHNCAVFLKMDTQYGKTLVRLLYTMFAEDGMTVYLVPHIPSMVVRFQ